MALLGIGLAICGRRVHQLSPARWLVNARKPSAIVLGARNLSYVPVDDIIAGLTEEQSQVRRTHNGLFHLIGVPPPMDNISVESVRGG